MLPYLERSGFVHSRYDKAVNDGCLFCVQCIYASSLVVVPLGENFGGKMVVRFACHFDDKG